MSDILNDIDEAIARNSKRFDPFGPLSGEKPSLGVATPGRCTCGQCGELAEPVGSAPSSLLSGPDRVANAFRAEVRRQGLTPCEIEVDGRREWLP